jgi:hypothetical protein
MRRMSTKPPANSAAVNSGPRKIHSTIPSSKTRLVEANMNASAAGSPAPFWNVLLAIAIAAYEHDDDAAPSPVAFSVDPRPRPPSTRSISPRVNQACTIPDSRKPRISAHHTSHAIWKAKLSASPIAPSTSVTAQSPGGRERGRP